jgi:tellurite resistance protein
LAGAGFKVFENGNVLTASEVNTFMMDQMIMVFADAAARDAAITSPSQGMFAFLKDDDKLTVFTDSWGDF